jgi:hypothetical protein
MVKTNFTQDGIGRSLLEMKRQISDGASTLGAMLAGREGVVSPFSPDPLPPGLLNLIGIHYSYWTQDLSAKSIDFARNVRKCGFLMLKFRVFRRYTHN